MKLFLFLILFSFSASAQSPSSVFSNRKGIAELKKSKPLEAQQSFLEALSNNPFQAELHLNLGLSFEALGQLEKAQASYETALKLAQTDETRFAANFNLGALAQKSKKVEEALKFYQEALKYNPQSVETKTNIELLIQEQENKKNKEDGKQQDQPKDQQGKGQGSDDQKEQGDQKKEGEQDKPKEYKQNKPQPRKFKSEELSQGDVNKILGEIKQQEQKIRAEFNKKEGKDKPREKDW